MTHLERALTGAACSSCGAPLPAKARFCPACGARVAAGGEERRVVTVLFADLVDSTRLVESLDPEAARGRLDDLFRHLAAEVRRLGGDRDRYAFHHVLFRDVAYALLPKAARSELHARLATWLAGELGSEREPPEAIAPHLVEAVRLAGEIRRPTAVDRALANRAVAACRQAAQRLRDQEALVAAAAVLDDALAMAEVAGTPAEDVAELRALRGSFRGVTGDPDGALADLEAAAHSGRAAVRAHAYTELSNLHGVLSDYDRAARLAERALAEAKATRSPGLLARALRAKALEPFVAGNLVECARLLEEALSLSGDADQPGLTIDLRSTLLPVRLYLATPLDDLAEQARELAAAARAHGRRNAEAGANWVLGEVRALQGDLAGAERHFAAADRQRRDLGLTSQLVWSLLGLARVAVARGDAGKARRFAEEAVAVTSRPDGVAEPDAFLHLAEACLVERDLDGAAAALDRARSSLQPVDVLLQAGLGRGRARLAAAQGDHETAAALLRRSLAALARTGYRLDRLRTAAQLVPALARVGREEESVELAGAATRQARAIGAHALTRDLERARSWTRR